MAETAVLSPGAFDAAILGSLQSRQHIELLDIIDNLRAQGLNEHINLPQLIVCGDQSSGKSSVLAAVSTVPFPKKDNLCTRFATEVVLRRDDNIKRSKFRVSITPSSSRPTADRSALEAFARDMSCVDDLPGAITDASLAMGLGVDGSAFSADIFRLEVRGPSLPQLTIVDLPGLIHSENKYQSADDVALVNSLVEEYMLQERSIILAVISAKNDYANQIVLTKARKMDPDGRRTLGIITKPDTLHPDSSGESAFLGLAQNHDVKFSLGWHVVRNQDSNKAEERDRDQLESEFFQTSRWNRISEASRGVVSLRNRLSEVLFRQIRRELPSLTSEISAGLENTKHSLARMGRSRATIQEKRMFVMEVGQKFHALCHSACEGSYDGAFFEEIDSSTIARRLRAVVQNANIDFADRMLDAPLLVPVSNDTRDPRPVSIVARAKDLINSYRGKELPGTFNPALIGHLFRELSRSWFVNTRDHANVIWLSARTTVIAILRAITEQSVCDACIMLVIDPELQKMQKAMEKRLDEYMGEFRRQPITYNHDWNKEVKAAKRERNRSASIARCRQLFKPRGHLLEQDVELIVDSLLWNDELDTEDSAQHLVDYAKAYYKVALKRMVDEVPAHVIEPMILTTLPQLIDSLKVLEMPDDLIETIGGESAQKTKLRESLQAKLEVLNRSSLICKVYADTTAAPDLGSPDASEGSLVEVSTPCDGTETLDGPEVEKPLGEVETGHPPEAIEPLEDDAFDWVPSKKKNKKPSQVAAKWPYGQ